MEKLLVSSSYLTLMQFLHSLMSNYYLFCNHFTQKKTIHLHKFFCFRLQEESKQSGSTTDSISTALQVATDLGFANIKEALVLTAALPVTSCEAERAFSKLAHLKTDLRSTMGHERYVVTRFLGCVTDLFMSTFHGHVLDF